MILKRLQNIVAGQQWQHKKILVAVSGGLDSMTLALLLQQSGIAMAIAHCNFGLRGVESDADEALVRSWAAAMAIPVYVQQFDTPALLEAQGGNLQELARELRYGWFETLRQELGFDLVATAHHRQDSVETLLINFFRGTGITGLHGILPQQGKIIRPLLAFTRAELEQYAREQELVWREDSSNSKDDYTRNAVRQHLLPAIEKIFPRAVDQLAGNTLRLREAELLYQESIERYRKKLIGQRGQDWYLPVLKLRQVQPLATILWELVKSFGFHAAQLTDILHLLDAESGRYVAAPDYRIIRNRNFLIITAQQAEASTHILIEAGEASVDAPGYTLTVRTNTFGGEEEMAAIRKLEPEQLCVDAGMLHFPLVLRPWKTGDYFYPLGKLRKKKKVSRYLIEQKVPLHEKEKVWVLESNKKIVWVVGRRADDRFRVTEQTVNCCYFSVKPR
ncbi:tRNA lysidine(34) synthetase TilS [Taibaiella koreensis]|uniref:tRNA lysidine(34) synthetase TilS n=1 Tax=Taibaiella koreensis TaxID=1268548 RepID=UPI0013C2E64D|nr:tRNA lysidine(34) synthetase TilS [Taibaiella koreensis]